MLSRQRRANAAATSAHKVGREIARRTEPARLPGNLAETRNAVRNILTKVGRYDFLDEYTTHSFDHVKDMLLLAEWIIPTQTFECMTSADALMIVLSIYLHDIDMQISRAEFDSRDKNPEYIKFGANLYAGDNEAKEYAAKLNALPDDQRDRITYQEFVRATHGDRARSWVEGVSLGDGGTADGSTVFDPRNGSGTTTYAAAHLRHAAVGYDLNPVMVVIA